MAQTESKEEYEEGTAEEELVVMPEFVQKKQEPFSKIIFRFETEEDLNAFAELIGQKLTPKTKSAWFPYRSHWHGKKRRWVG